MRWSQFGFVAKRFLLLGKQSGGRHRVDVEFIFGVLVVQAGQFVVAVRVIAGGRFLETVAARPAVLLFVRLQIAVSSR